MRKTPVFRVFKKFKPHNEAKMVPAAMTTSTNQGIQVLNASASIDAAKAPAVAAITADRTRKF